MADEVRFYNTFLMDTNGKHLASTERAINPYYSPDFCYYMLVHVFPYYPVLTRSVFEIFGLAIKDDTTNRAENHHHILKNLYHVGHLNQHPARFVREQSTWIQAGAKEFLATLPSDKKISEKWAAYYKNPTQSKNSSNVQNNPGTSDKESSSQPVSSKWRFQEWRKEDRKSPEKYTEEFKKKYPRTTRVPYPSVYQTASFIPWGGRFTVNEQEYILSNTCNLDCVLETLYLLYNHNSIARGYITEWMNRGDLKTQHVVNAINEISRGNFSEAKKIWITELIKMPLSRNKYLNLEEEEREHGFGPIKHWMRVFRRKQCYNTACQAFRSDDVEADWEDLSKLHRDTEAFSVLDIYRFNTMDLLDSINNGVFLTESMESVCWTCRETTNTTFNFPGGPPMLFFYSLQGLGAPNPDMDSTLKSRYTIQGFEYDVFAYSLHTGRHIYSIINDGDKKSTYDGLKAGFIDHCTNVKDPIISVWMIRSQ